MAELINLKAMTLAENNLSGSFPELIFSMPKLQLLQMQNNNFEDVTATGIRLGHAQLALLDIDEKADRYKINDFKDLFIHSATGTADTKFEDESN
jgi:Leucine-rich repeat (LRR) protein